VKQAIREMALGLGFDAFAVACTSEPLTDDFSHYEAFVDQGMHGPMEYLARNRTARRDLDLILEGARSTICVAQRYAVKGEPSGVAAHIARYARGRDYHGHMRRTLDKLAGFVASLQPAARARAVCDTAPVLERAWAARAGLGFVGKNGMLIIPGMGSYVLLGEVVTTIELASDRPQPSRCGACESCLQACPTSALVSPHVLDARRCIACLTIETRGPYDAAFEPMVGTRLFGCDTCQDVCPHNTTQRSVIEPGSPYDTLPMWTSSTLASLLDVQREQLHGSPLKRCGEQGWLRNIAVVMGNSGDLAYAPALQRMAKREDWVGEVAKRALKRGGVLVWAADHQDFLAAEWARRH
jgi:epoxyqueuosine reductase